MGLFKSLLGKKTFCSVCGAPLPPNRMQGADGGEPVCSDRCRDALDSLSHSQGGATSPKKRDVVTVVDVFGLPEVTIYVFRTNEAAPFYALQERIIESYCEPGLRVSRLDSSDLSLVAVAGPKGTMMLYRKAVRVHLGSLAREAKVRSEEVRPDATYSNISASGTLRPSDPAVVAVCDKIRRGIFRPVFTGPPTVPPSSSAPVLRAMTDEVLMNEAVALVERHVSFFPGGVLKVESDGLCEAGLLFSELARRRPNDPEPAYLEASAFALATRHDVAEQRIESLLRNFPDHLESCLLAASGKSVFDYPSYDIGKPIPGSIRDRTKDVSVALTRSGRNVRPVMFVDLRGRQAPTDPSPVAYPIFFQEKSVPIIGVAVVFSDGIKQRFEAIVAGFEEHNGRARAAPRACYLFRAPSLPVVLHEQADPVACTEASFDGFAHEAFKACEAAFRAMEPRSFAIQDLSAALDAYSRSHPLDQLAPSGRENRA